jgi:hypothetical protein
VFLSLLSVAVAAVVVTPLTVVVVALVVQTFATSTILQLRPETVTQSWSGLLEPAVLLGPGRLVAVVISVRWVRFLLKAEVVAVPQAVASARQQPEPMLARVVTAALDLTEITPGRVLVAVRVVTAVTAEMALVSKAHPVMQGMVAVAAPALVVVPLVLLRVPAVAVALGC